MTPHSSRRTAFTLVEMLVAVTILSIILLTLAQAMGIVSRLWTEGIGAVDNLSKARQILDLLDRDVQSMVLRPDAPAFVDASGNPACAFYSNIQGSPGTDCRSVSLVQYMLNPTGGSTAAEQTTLGRLNFGMNFSTASGSAITPRLTAASPPTPTMAQLPSSTSQNTENIATGVIRFQWQFIDSAGNLITPSATAPFSYDFISPSASSNPRTLVVSILVLDNPSYQLALKSSTLLAKLQGDFGTTLPTAGSETYSQYWNYTLNPSTGTFDTTLPASVRSGLKAFSRYVELPVVTP